ncbi:KIN2 [Candida theae]|uniref:non-specific serine/threonine protein kinase n=1 Tax=Candida theae TaxID=1198502 RepID=A0AAD5BD04_9ASCO|nr:KIN2 [Candida theae]KAI5954873.1 KIN2 [Candida theae]
MEADQPFTQRDISKSQLPDANSASTPLTSHPATPRMLRSGSGNVKMSSDAAATKSNDRSQDAQLLPPLSIPSPAATPVGAVDAEVIKSGSKPLPKPREMTSQVQSPSHQMNRTPSTPNQYSHSQPHQRQSTPQRQPQYESSRPSSLQPQQQQPQQQQQQQQQQFHRKSIGDWNFVKTIGAGSMGKVKLAQHNTTHEICAVKIIPRAAKLYQRAHAHDPPPQTSQEAAQRHKEFEKELARDKRTIREGALGRLLFHPFICRLYEMVPMTNHYYMLFEYIEGGQMLDYIVAHGSLKEKHARKFARGIASALDYCHRNNVVHRDLKIENIMINEKGDVKIIDFGLSNLYSPKSLLKTYCGSLYFAAPELLSAKPYIGPEVDIWSFGVVLYVLVCGKVPFDDQSVSVLHEKIKKGSVEYPNFLSKECINLLSRMLVVDPNRRASLYEICSHPWMNKGYDHKVSNYLPRREPLRLPLDPDVIKQIAAFDLGSAQSVAEELTTLLTSVEYQMSSENWYNITRQGKEYASASNSNILPDPTGGFHPLISIYYLVLEMRKRKRAKEEAIKAQLAQQEQQKHYQQQKLLQQQQQAYASLPTPKEDFRSQPVKAGDTQAEAKPSQYTHEIATQVPIVGQYNPSQEAPKTPQPRIVETFAGSPSKTLDPKRDQSPKPAPPSATQTPVISIPEQAHTSAVPSTFENPPIVSVTGNDQIAIPEQQPKSPRSTTPIDSLDPTRGAGAGAGGAGINNLFRKLSSKKSKGTASPKIVSPPGHDTGSTRGGSPQSSQSTLDPLVRRGVSMKVTAKEKESGVKTSPTRPERKERKQDTATHAHSASTSTPSRPHGFIPVEYLPPLPNYDPSTNTVTQNTSTKQQTLAVPSRKLHPTARAKSVGGQIRKDAYGRGRSNTATHNTANVELAHSTSPHHTELSFDESATGALFDDVALDDMEVQEVPQLTEDEIIKQYDEAKPGSMPSIEHCKTLFLKGFFSVQTTSTKPLPVIRYNIISVLSRLGVRFQEVKGGFICVHTPSVQQQAQPQLPATSLQHEDDAEDQILDAYVNDDDENEEENELYGDAFRSKSSTLKSSSFDDPKVEVISEGARTPSRQCSVNLRSGGTLSPSTSQSKPQRSLTVSGGGAQGHRRKVSIGNAFLNTYRKKNNSQVQMPPNTPATARTIRGMYGGHDGDDDFDDKEDGSGGNGSNRTEVDFANDTLDLDNSADSLSGYAGGSDMLISSKIEHRASHQRTTSSISNSSQHQHQQHQHRRSVGGGGGGAGGVGAGSGPSGSKSPLKFEIHIVKVPLVGLYGVQFKKLLGNTWNYKTLAGQILNEMNL